MKNKKRLAILASGNGSNLQAIIDSIKNSLLENIEIGLIISNKENAYALVRGKNENIKTVFLNPKDFISNEEYDKKLVEIILKENIDLIVLAGYMKILTSVFINNFKNKIINIHPSLLPKYGGKGMYGKHVHEAVLKAKENESGCTTHFVTEEVDAGKIILQRKVKVLPDDTVDTLQARILEEEHMLIVETIKKVCNYSGHCEQSEAIS